jgi:hypothetical protein
VHVTIPRSFIASTLDRRFLKKSIDSLFQTSLRYSSTQPRLCALHNVKHKSALDGTPTHVLAFFTDSLDSHIPRLDSGGADVSERPATKATPATAGRGIFSDGAEVQEKG